MSDLTPEIEERARRLADEISAQRKGLDYEDAGCGGHPTYVRAKKHRDADRAKLNGMVIALTFILGRPNDMQLVEEFIEDEPTWRALL